MSRHKTKPELYILPQPEIKLIDGKLLQCKDCGKFFNADYSHDCNNCGYSNLLTYAIGKFQTEWFDDMSIDVIRKHKGMFYLINPHGELFRAIGGVIIDKQSCHVLRLIYDATSDKTKDKFNNIIFKNEYIFANFLDKMWSMVTYKRS